MKKGIIALALALFCIGASAQDFEVPVRKYSVATNGFWSNWYLQLGIGAHANYTSEESSQLSFNPFSSARGQMGFSVALGKWFTPAIGLRTKFQGIRAKKVFDQQYHPSYDYWNLHEDLTFNLSHLLLGYNERRLWSFIPYAGVGVVRNMNDNVYDISYNAGLLNTFRINDKFNLFLDVYATAFEGSNDAATLPDNWQGWRKEHSRYWDKMLGFEIGVTYHLGRSTWDKVPDVNALIAMNKEQMDALNASLEEQQAENERLQQLLENQQAPEAPAKTETKYIGAAASVFFNLNSSVIASRKDLVTVKELVELAKANHARLKVTGYADSRTGDPAANKTISDARAKAVVAELLKMGVAESDIIVVSQGGVDTLSPYSYNRRATVEMQ